MSNEQEDFWKQFYQQRKADEEMSKKLLFDGCLSKKEFRSLVSCIFRIKSSILIFYPKLFKRCPQLIDRCNWNLLECKEWIFLLQESPEYSNKCDKWDKFDAGAWFSLLSAQPQFADKCDKWDKFDGQDWKLLLSWQSQLATKCDWNKLNNCHFHSSWERGEFWGRLLKEQPQFIDKCDWSNFDSATWVKVLESLPQLANKCDKWDEFRTWDWSSLLCHQPQFADKCNYWGKFDCNDWKYLLQTQPQFISKCNKTTVLVNFLLKHPQYIEYCDTSFITEKGKAKLLAKHPDQAKYFNDKNGK